MFDRAMYDRERYILRVKPFRDYKEEHPCADCGKYYHYWIMDFDHRPGVHKIADVAKMLRNKMYTVAQIWKEIKKCDLVCANCHRDRTQRRDHPEDYR